MENVTRLPTAPKTYFTVRKSRKGFDVVMATPGGPKTIRSVLARAHDRETAVAEARRIAAMCQRPCKV